MQEPNEQRRECKHDRGSPAEVFTAFLKLGLTSFGGPIAHLGYFHRELIERRRWVDEAQYAQLLALSQFLPGPASSQLGFALGLVRAGWLGAFAAFFGFTMPSVLLLVAFARILPSLNHPLGEAAIHGLKLVATAVVAHGVLAMARRLTPDMTRALIAVVGAGLAVGFGSAFVQLLVIAMGALLGLAACRQTTEVVSSTPLRLPYGNRLGFALIGSFAILLLAALLIHDVEPLVATAAAFFRAGALVFGGGHVVLPLLEESVVAPGWISADEFLAGYGAVQAAPGPLFSLAAFLGARLDGGQGGMFGAAVSTAAIFLPGFLLICGALPLWRKLQSRKQIMSALTGVNAAVVGLLAAALYDPVWTSAILTPLDFVIALGGFALLALTRASVLWAITWCVLASVVRTWTRV